jgi:hypothetical protein
LKKEEGNFHTLWVLSKTNGFFWPPHMLKS